MSDSEKRGSLSERNSGMSIYHASGSENAMGSLVDAVDPFLGNGATDLPPAEGLAAAWFWPKAQTGNTHPGAGLPWGWVTVLPWSGAYPTGYGLNRPSNCGQPQRLHESPVAAGFTHFHHSGIGAVGEYYNHLRLC